MSNGNNLSETTTQLSEELYSALTLDGVVKSFRPDFVIRELSESQFQQWKQEVESQHSEYLLEQTIRVSMTQDQHEELDSFIKEAFATLTQENNFESEFVKINFTTHFIDRIRKRKHGKISTSFKHRAQLRGFVTEFNNIENNLRWNDSGLSYRLTNNRPPVDPASSERISISIRLAENGTGIILDITLITFFIKKRRKKKKAAE